MSDGTAPPGRPPRRPVRVAIVDDHPIVRDGLRHDLGTAEDLEVVGEAESVAQARGLLEAMQPDVAIVDVRLPDGTGIEVIREARARDPRLMCLVFTSFSDDDAFFQSILAGACGYLLKDASPEAVVAATRKAAAGESLIKRDLLDTLRARAAEPPVDDEIFRDLTPQERRILRQVAAGATNREIADGMGLAEKTVRNYMSNILAKLGMKNRTQLAAAVARMVPRRA